MIKTKTMRGFWCGVGLTVSTYSLIEDIIGKEGWSKLVNNGWVSPAFSVPVALVCFLFYFISLYGSYKKEIKKE